MTALDTDLDEYITCASAFKVLREVLQHWQWDRDNHHPADMLCRSFQKWLQSPASAPSKLHDPLLHRLIHKLTCQVFHLLLRRLKQLDCKIIYASFHKIIIYTGKTTLDEAEQHVSFAIRTAQKEKLFANIKMATGEAYRILLFKDANNYAGIRESSSNEVYQQMDIVNHLPEAVRRVFSILV